MRALWVCLINTFNVKLSVYFFICVDPLTPSLDFYLFIFISAYTASLHDIYFNVPTLLKLDILISKKQNTLIGGWSQTAKK